MTRRFATIDDYIHSLPAEVQVILEQVQRTVRAAALATGETIRYDMPTITLHGKDLLHVAAWKHHISLYAIPAVDGDVEQALAPYRTAKGMVKFPLGKPIPYDRTARAVALCVTQRAESETQSAARERATTDQRDPTDRRRHCLYVTVGLEWADSGIVCA